MMKLIKSLTEEDVAAETEYANFWHLELMACRDGLAICKQIQHQTHDKLHNLL